MYQKYTVPAVCNRVQSLRVRSAAVWYAYGYGSGTRTPRHWSAGVASPKQPSRKAHRMIFAYRNGPRKDRNGARNLKRTSATGGLVERLKPD